MNRYQHIYKAIYEMIISSYNLKGLRLDFILVSLEIFRFNLSFWFCKAEFLLAVHTRMLDSVARIHAIGKAAASDK